MIETIEIKPQRWSATLIRGSVSDISKLGQERLSRCNVNCASPTPSQPQMNDDVDEVFSMIRLLAQIRQQRLSKCIPPDDYE